jgi:hypothetical protein
MIESPLSRDAYRGFFCLDGLDGSDAQTGKNRWASAHHHMQADIPAWLEQRLINV